MSSMRDYHTPHMLQQQQQQQQQKAAAAESSSRINKQVRREKGGHNCDSAFNPISVTWVRERERDRERERESVGGAVGGNCRPSKQDGEGSSQSAVGQLPRDHTAGMCRRLLMLQLLPSAATPDASHPSQPQGATTSLPPPPTATHCRS